MAVMASASLMVKKINLVDFFFLFTVGSLAL